MIPFPTSPWIHRMGFTLSFCLRDSTGGKIHPVLHLRQLRMQLSPERHIHFQSLRCTARLRVLFLRQRKTAFSENFSCLTLYFVKIQRYYHITCVQKMQ